MNRTLTSVTLVVVFSSVLSAADPPVDFDRDIRPILADRCFQCHGPDANHREAELRLDIKEDMFAARDDGPAIVPLKSPKSVLYQRIASLDEDERMPPADFARKLTDQQIELIRRWIDSGAEWSQHWSLVAPTRPEIPQVKNRQWIRNPIDAFVLRRLEHEGLSPSTEAEKTTLIRRVSFDLIGLPPSPGQVDSFLADTSDQAYERLVDSLLKSPRYGERMASPWLDAARYADTSGYQNDGPRDMWRWRDWVIEAFNKNQPYDQFVLEQIAGDMLPHATLDQKIASGFNRNHRGNAEGGIIPEEFQVEYVVDRVETTFTVFLGMTMGCARCHEHKFDPIEQEEFYRVYAYFNNVPESGRAVKIGNSPPFIKAPTRQQQTQLAEIDHQLVLARQAMAKMAPSLNRAQQQWEKSSPLSQPEDWSISQGLVAHYPLDADIANHLDGDKKSGLTNASDENNSGPVTPEFSDGDPSFAPGRLGQAVEFDGQRFIDAGDVADFGFFDKFSISAWVFPQGSKGGTILSRMADADRESGWQVRLKQGKLQVNFVKRWLDDSIRIQTAKAIALDRWSHVMVTYDGSRVAAGVRVYVDGVPQKIDVLLDGLNQEFKSTEPLRIGGGGGAFGRFHGLIDGVRIYEQCLSTDQVSIIALADSIGKILANSPAERSSQQKNKLRAFFMERYAPQNMQRVDRQIAEWLQKKEQLVEIISTVMVMQEKNPPRETHVLNRGEYDKKGEKVTPGVPSCFPPLPAGETNNRLGFARWLVDSGNPLTARVAVNRFWQMIFGAGLVVTTEDFGTQGERPTHPQLLDWLASEFIESGWDVKSLQKLIVTSATYRQSSKISAVLLERDPDNQLLARGSRYRLPAEMIRDSMLAASGLLVDKLGGPSVKPYQPDGLWNDIATDKNYLQSKGDDLYRRSLYTYWKRTVAAPAMMTFDASAREACSVRRSRTNTSLQALTLMNDVTFVESARVLAQRIMREGGQTPKDRLTLAFRLATARRPNSAELDILLAGFQQHLARYRDHLQAAQELIKTGESPLDEELNSSELAAYTTIASLILNLDETVTKE